MSDHVRCGRLEAATSSVRDWWVWRSLHRLCATASWDHNVVDVACTPGDGDAVSTGYSRHSDCCRLLSDAFHDYAVHYSTDASADGSPLMTTASYLATEEAEAVKCQEMFEVVRKYETLHTNTWQVGAELAAHGICTRPAPGAVKHRQSHCQSSPMRARVSRH